MACVVCGEEPVERTFGICADCVRAERESQGRTASLYDDPANVAAIAHILGSHRPAVEVA